MLNCNYLQGVGDSDTRLMLKFTSTALAYLGLVNAVYVAPGVYQLTSSLPPSSFGVDQLHSRIRKPTVGRGGGGDNF